MGSGMMLLVHPLASLLMALVTHIRTCVNIVSLVFCHCLHVVYLKQIWFSANVNEVR